MSEESSAEKPKKKRGRPKGSKNKPKTDKPKVEKPKEEPKVEKPKEEPKVEKPKEEPKEESTALEKKEEPEKPKPKEYTPEEIEEISKRVEIPSDQTPSYKPQHMLSPEYGGTSGYEIGIKNQREEMEKRLSRLRSDPNASSQEIKQAEEDLKTLNYLYENYNLGMNVFRTAKGGRDKLRV